MRTEALARIDRLLTRNPGRRVLLGIAGTPGSGKSTVARWLVRELEATGVATAWVPMDGFHLADSELSRLGRLGRKGAIDTFDGYGYLALLTRTRTETGNVVYAPEFDRALEQPIAGGMPVPPEARVVVTEGNYLLDDTEPWTRLADLLDEVWFCDLEDRVRRERLVQRHVRFGKTTSLAEAWVDEVDEVNARRIARGRERASWRVAVAALDLPASEYP